MTDPQAINWPAVHDAIMADAGIGRFTDPADLSVGVIEEHVAYVLTSDRPAQIVRAHLAPFADPDNLPALAAYA